MPHLKELHEKFAEKGLVILGVHTQGSKETVAAFVKEQKLSYLVAVDAAGKSADGSDSTIGRYKVDSYPDYYLVDRAGRLRFADLANQELARTVEYLIAEAPPKDEKEKK